MTKSLGNFVNANHTVTDAREHKAGADAHRERCQRVLAQLPKEMHQLAYVLLAHADDHGMDDAAIIRAANIGGASLRRPGNMPKADVPGNYNTEPALPQNLSQRDLYLAGVAAAQELLGITPSAPVLAEQAQPTGFVLDKNAYAMGEAVAKQIMALAGRKIGDV